MTVLDKIRATIRQHALISRSEKILVAVSGGPDSLTLLHLLLALRDEWQLQLHVAHLNHQLRGAESNTDADFVAQLAREWNLPATVELRDVAAYARERKLSIEEAAREMRYAFLVEVAKRVGAHSIAVAHTRDDQAETVLMHLLRGSGLGGLRGMLYKSQIPNSKPQIYQPRNELLITNYELQIIRPLLDVTRTEIESYCKQNSLTPRFDRSNLDTTLFRNRLRHEVLPYLESLNPRFREILSHTSRSISDDYNYLESQARVAYLQVARTIIGGITFNREAWRQLHPALQRMTLRIAIQHLRSDLRNIDWAHIEDARRIVLDNGTGAVAILPHGLRLTVGYDEFIVGNEQSELPMSDVPQLNVECVPVPERGVVNLPGLGWVLEVAKADPHSFQLPSRERGWGRGWTALLDAQKIAGQLFLRRRRAGDRFQPAGMNGHSKSLHEFMIDEKIPRVERDGLPLLMDNEKILWVCGYRVDERVRVTDATREVLQITFKMNKNE